MTDVELAQATALARCKFSPGSAEKRFVRWAAAHDPSAPFSAKASAFLDRLAHSYRKQIGRCMSAACTSCKPAAPKLPTISYELDDRTNTKWGRIRRQKAKPTFEQAVAILERAESNGAKYVHWHYRNTGEYGESFQQVVSIHRCECSEVVLRTNVCRACQLIASLVVDTDQRGTQVQFERAERALDRLAQVVDRLQHKVREVQR